MLLTVSKIKQYIKTFWAVFRVAADVDEVNRLVGRLVGRKVIEAVFYRQLQGRWCRCLTCQPKRFVESRLQRVNGQILAQRQFCFSPNT